MTSLLFASLAGLIHIYIFFMESILWGQPGTNRMFKVSPDQAEAGRVWAFNQGYYNLFLAIAVFIGIGAALLRGSSEFADTLLVYSCLSMIGASVVLLFSNPGALAAAVFQGGAPTIAVAAWVIEYLKR